MGAKKESATAKYFEVLGLPLDAGGPEIEARYQELTAHFNSDDMPAQLQGWAQEQASKVD